MELDPQAGGAIEALHDAGWEVIVASAGCHWYIDQLLAGQHIQVTVYANPGKYDPQHGLQMSPPVDCPFFTPSTGIDKLAVVRQPWRARRWWRSPAMARPIWRRPCW
jgi:2-hydroxy-3-keto-5-methylthiopentenyl-1-phosphate phosphatase